MADNIISAAGLVAVYDAQGAIVSEAALAAVLEFQGANISMANMYAIYEEIEDVAIPRSGVVFFNEH